MRTLLVITRQPSIAHAVQTVLDPVKFQLITKEAIGEAEFLLSRGAIDATILDAELTDARAIRLIEEVKSFAPGCPILMYAGEKQWEWEEDAYLQGVQHVLTKPIRGKLLQSLLNRLFPSTEEKPAAAVPELEQAEPFRTRAPHQQRTELVRIEALRAQQIAQRPLTPHLLDQRQPRRAHARLQLRGARLRGDLQALQQRFGHVPLQRGAHVAIEVRRGRRGREATVRERLEPRFERQFALEDEARARDSAGLRRSEARHHAIDHARRGRGDRRRGRTSRRRNSRLRRLICCSGRAREQVRKGAEQARAEEREHAHAGSDPHESRVRKAASSLQLGRLPATRKAAHCCCAAAARSPRLRARWSRAAVSNRATRAALSRTRRR